MAKNTAIKGKSTQNSLLINEIKDGVVIMRDGSLRGVIMGSAINFDLMSGQEQNGVEVAYQGFLNSLHFPVQIVIRSQKVDLSQYLDMLENRRIDQTNELLGILMDDYIDNINSLLDQVNIMDKQFYVVVPYYPPVTAAKTVSLVTGLKGALQPMPQITISETDFHNYKKELSERVALVSNGMAQMGIRAIALGTQELVDLYYNWYNPEVAVNEKLIDVSQLQTPIVTRGDGSAPSNLPGATQ
jgi:type IV secretory pathway VirB4 component